MRSRGFNGFLTQRQGPLDFEVRYKSGIFWLVSKSLTRRSPFIVVALSRTSATQTEASVVPLSWPGSLVDHFWQVRRYKFQSLID